MSDEFLLIVAAVSLILYAFYKWVTINNDYFVRRNIKCMKPTFFIGNMIDMYFNICTGAEFANKLYQTFPNER